MYEIPHFGLRAYALFYSKYGSRESFAQSELAWIVSPSMRKKIFSTLLNAGWLKKVSRQEYICTSPDSIFKGLLDFKVPTIMQGARKPYSFTGLSAVEVWSDFSYVQRGRERSPYFINVLERDILYWKNFCNKNTVPYYVREGSTIGEFIILIPVKKIGSVEKNGFFVESLKKTMSFAKNNDMFSYPYKYMKNKYGDV